MGVDLSCQKTFAELADLWFDLYQEGNADLHKRSKETTKNTLNRYILPVLGKMKVIDIKPINIQQLMSGVSKYSKSTQKKVLQTTRAIFRVAMENGMIARSPVSEQIKAGGAAPAEKTPLTEDQCQSLLDAVKGTRAYLLVLVLLYSGLRIGEALGLSWLDIDFDAGTLTVNRSIIYPEENRRGEINLELKTKKAHRTIPLPLFVVDELRKAKAVSNSVWVFAMQDGSFFSYDSFRALWRLIDYRSKVKHTVNGREYVERTLDFSVHPHLLRHTCITRWFNQGLNVKAVQYLAGHATVDITLGIYTHYQEEQSREETANRIRATS